MLIYVKSYQHFFILLIAVIFVKKNALNEICCTAGQLNC